LVDCVPQSIPRNPGEQVEGHLVQPLVPKRVIGKRHRVKALSLERLGIFGRPAQSLAELPVRALGRASQRLDLLVVVEALNLLLEDEIAAYAAAHQIPDLVWCVGAVWLHVEGARPVPGRVFQQLDQEKGLLDVLGAESEVLVVSAGLLRSEVDVEQLARLQRLGDVMDGIQPGHA
jgi:hypothetical protein